MTLDKLVQKIFQHVDVWPPMIEFKGLWNEPANGIFNSNFTKSSKHFGTRPTVLKEHSKRTKHIKYS